MATEGLKLAPAALTGTVPEFVSMVRLALAELFAQLVAGLPESSAF